MAGRMGGYDDGPIAEINVVPLVDIILVVLIIFMVTAPMIMKPSIDVNLPKASSGTQSPPSKLNISVTKSGTIVLNGQKSDLESLKKYVEDIVVKSPTVQAVISADKTVPHGTVISIIDLVKLAGVTKFAISVEKKR